MLRRTRIRQPRRRRHRQVRIRRRQIRQAIRDIRALRAQVHDRITDLASLDISNDRRAIPIRCGHAGIVEHIGEVHDTHAATQPNHVLIILHAPSDQARHDRGRHLKRPLTRRGIEHEDSWQGRSAE